ncbi:MAG: T9SS type A sorting domain-containing protein [Ignavibacteriales bacterium]|nr:T9SS type A sorting domain-containing protein [Ignavibacteriales bacterium]MCF8315599.1 T9SS type A sorting domain-containing protein [Ignavibacteriales bacterium]MCF8437207.1 T9SS type A sorting domain-containing protein [Ignavibacteriales bacterium]
MRQILFTLLISLLVITPEVSGQNPPINFPLEIGNIWQYSESPGHFSHSVAVYDTLMPNGKTYTYIQGDLAGGYFRKEGAKLYAYGQSGAQEKLRYDFSLAIGDTMSFEIFGEDTVITTVSAAGIREIFGLDKYYMSFHMESVNSSGDAEFTITDGFGLTRSVGELLFYGLTAAVINGAQFGLIVDVKTPGQGIPADFSLHQNYPNPFNPATKISFNLPQASDVSLKVYDILGNQAAVLLNGFLDAGSYSYEFDGAGLSNGIYFYRIKAGNFNSVKKMILLK